MSATGARCVNGKFSDRLVVIIIMIIRLVNVNWWTWLDERTCEFLSLHELFFPFFHRIFNLFDSLNLLISNFRRNWDLKKNYFFGFHFYLLDMFNVSLFQCHSGIRYIITWLLCFIPLSKNFVVCLVNFRLWLSTVIDSVIYYCVFFQEIRSNLLEIYKCLCLKHDSGNQEAVSLAL